MLAYTREVVMDRLIELAKLQKDFSKTGQLEELDKWLDNLHEELGKLRNPLASRASNVQAAIKAAWEGHRGDGTDPSVPLRKARRIAVNLTLIELSESLTAEVMGIDQKFEIMSDKLAQLLAAASALSPLPGPNGNMSLWKGEVWSELGKHEATQGMYTYLTSSLAKADRDHLLDTMLTRLAANGSTNGGT